jgi:hypothetical protein
MIIKFLNYLTESVLPDDIKRHANGLKKAFEKSNEWEMYELGTIRMLLIEFDELKRVAKHLTINDTKECNGELKEGEWERKNEKLERLADEFAEKIGFMAYHQQDPRGCPLYVGRNLNELNYYNGIAIL